MMKLIPNEVRNVFKKWFDFPKRDIHCQIATTSNDRPHIRTMRLYEITPSGELLFLSRNDTQKWHDLKAFPYFAATLVSQDFGQIVVEGTAKLKSPNDPEYQKYWKALPPMFREIYLYDLKDADSWSYVPPPTFGVIELHPELWEVLEVNKQDYLSSSRTQWRLRLGLWEEKTLQPV